MNAMLSPSWHPDGTKLSPSGQILTIFGTLSLCLKMALVLVLRGLFQKVALQVDFEAVS